jgi:hypothetical protein
VIEEMTDAHTFAFSVRTPRAYAREAGGEGETGSFACRSALPAGLKAAQTRHSQLHVIECERPTL